MADLGKKKNMRSGSRQRSAGATGAGADGTVWRRRIRIRMLAALLLLLLGLGAPMYVMLFDRNGAVYSWVIGILLFLCPFAIGILTERPLSKETFGKGLVSVEDLLYQIKSHSLYDAGIMGAITTMAVALLGFIASFREAEVLWLDIPAVFWFAGGMCLLLLIGLYVLLRHYRKECSAYREGNYAITLSELTGKENELNDDGKENGWVFFFDNAKIPRGTRTNVSKQNYDAARMGELYYLLISDGQIIGSYRAADHELDGKLQQRLIVEESDPDLHEKQKYWREELIREAQEITSPEQTSWKNIENATCYTVQSGTRAGNRRKKRRFFSPFPLLITLALLVVLFLLLEDSVFTLLPLALLPLLWYAKPIHRLRIRKKSEIRDDEDSQPTLLNEQAFARKPFWESVNGGVVFLAIVLAMLWAAVNLIVQGDGTTGAGVIVMCFFLLAFVVFLFCYARKRYRERMEMLKKRKLKILELPALDVSGRNSTDGRRYLKFPGIEQETDAHPGGSRKEIPRFFYIFSRFPAKDQPRAGELFYLLLAPRYNEPYDVLDWYRKKDVRLSSEMTRYLTTLKALKEDADMLQ